MAAALAACEKNAVQVIAGLPPGGANIRFYNFGVGAPSVNFYANTTKMTAVAGVTCSPLPPSASSPPPALDPACLTTGIEPTTGVAYAGVASGGLYSSVAAGQYTFAGKISATTDKDLAISTVTTTLEDGKYYSFFMSGIYSTATKTVDGFVVEDPVAATFDYTQAYVRFVNAISNSSPLTLYAKSTTDAALPEIAAGGAVVYKAAGAFTAVPFGVYDLNARLTGSSTNTITLAAQTFAAGRYYTIIARGDMTQSGTSATRPLLSLTTNR